jgi:outer membrane protein TolC
MERLRVMFLRGSMVTAVLLPSGCAKDGSAREVPAFADVARLSAAAPLVSRGNMGPSELGEGSTLADYLAYAAAKNPALQAAYYRWQAARERIPQAAALDDPQLTYRYFIGGMGFGGDMEQRQGLGLSQPVPWPAKLLLRVRLAETEAQVEQKRLEVARFKLNYDVTVAYAEYWYLSQALAVTQENVRLMRYLEGVARARYTAGTGMHPDVLRAQMELGKLENDTRALRDLQGPTVAKLNAVLNRPVDSPLPWPKETPAQAAPIDEKQLLASLREANPELKAMDLEVGRQDLRRRLARQDYMPDFMVGVEWMDMTATSGGMMEADDTWAVMAGMSLPIWWGKYAAGVREAQAMQQAAVDERADKANTLAVDAKLAAYGLRDAQRRMDLYKDALLPKARQAIEAVQASYRTGAASLLEGIDAQRTLLEFELNYRRALAESWQRLAELEMLLGRQLPAPPATTGPAAQTQPPGPRGAASSR